MAWNEPGGSKKDTDPWGKPSGDQGPPDLDEVVRKLQDKLSRLFGGKAGGGGGGGAAGPGFTAPGAGLVGALIGVVAIIWLASGLYIVAPAERGVVLRFGAYTDSAMPGLHWRWPWPVGAVQKVNVEEIRTLEIGFRSSGRGQKGQPKLDEALMLTRDENIVDIKIGVQYRVKDAAAFLFKVLDPEVTLQQVVESALREVVGKSDMDFVLTEGRSDIAGRVSVLTQETLDRYGAGLLVTGINMQDAQPPEQVQDSFHDAVKAREDEQRLKNEAEAYANDIIPKARGAAARQIEEANAYKEQVIAQAQGEASRFSQILAQYRTAPEVTRQRLYLETMEQVMTSANKVIVDVNSGSNVLYLPLDRLGGAAERSSLPSMSDVAGATSAVPAVTAPEERSGGSMREALRSRERR